MKQIYDGMWENAIDRIHNGQNAIDTLIDDPGDTRKGLSLILRPNAGVSDRIAGFLNGARQIEPRQYYIDRGQAHVTVMSIVSCTDDFNINELDVSKYVDEIQSSLSHILPFEIRFRGVTASPSCVLAQGFPLGDSLDQIRKALRYQFQQSDLRSTIDQRYSIATAHSTLVRFREPLFRPRSFAAFLKEYRTSDFGDMEVPTLSLVTNDWYHRPVSFRELHRFRLTP